MEPKKGLLIPVLATRSQGALISPKFDNNFDNLKQQISATQHKKAMCLESEKIGGTWFIIWYNFNPASGRLERIRKTFNLNRIAHLRERREVAKHICALLNIELARGYNYYIHEFSGSSGVSAAYPGGAVYTKLSEQAAPASKHENIVTALLWALRRHNKNLKLRSAGSYKSALTVFTDWLTDNGRASLKVAGLTNNLVLDYIEHRQDQGLVAKTINTQVGFLHTLFAYLVKDGEAKDNPFTVTPLKETETEKFISLTTAELAAISEKLAVINPDFLLYLQFIYWQAIRPAHIGIIRASNIDYAGDILTTTGEANKNRKVHKQQLMSSVKAGLVATNRHSLPGDWYLFGTNFLPSPDHCHRLGTRAGELWQSLVVDGLGIKKYMYALKHTFNQSLLENNDAIDSGWLQRHNKHSSLEQTETYIRKRKVKRVNEEGLNIDAF